MYKFLETLSGAACAAIDVFDVIVTTRYGSSYSRLQYELSRRGRARERKRQREAAKQQFYNLVHKLKRDGLVQEEKHGQERLLALTRKGREKIKSLRNQLDTQLPPRQYPKEEDKVFTIVAFDIPETEKRKRAWLREVLRRLEFTMIQKSVWIGKAKIPEALIRDLSALKILEFVEIFSIAKTGSLARLTEHTRL